MIVYLTSVHTQIGVVSMGSRGGKGKDVDDATNSWYKTNQKEKKKFNIKNKSLCYYLNCFPNKFIKSLRKTLQFMYAFEVTVPYERKLILDTTYMYLLRIS